MPWTEEKCGKKTIYVQTQMDVFVVLGETALGVIPIMVFKKEENANKFIGSLTVEKVKFGD